MISENQAILIFAIVLIVAAGIAWWMGTYADYDKGSFHTFIAVLAGLGIFITFLFYYNLVLLQNQQQQLAAMQEVSQLNESVVNSVLGEIKTASIIIPNFVLSITPLTNQAYCPTGHTGYTGVTGCLIPVAADPVNPQTCSEKMVLSYRIFAVWQDVIVSNGFIDFDPTAYVSNFLQRTNSRQLYEQWTTNRLNFNDTTQVFGDLLFEYGLPITEQVPKSYQDAAQKLIADPRYEAIFDK